MIELGTLVPTLLRGNAVSRRSASESSTSSIFSFQRSSDCVKTRCARTNYDSRSRAGAWEREFQRRAKKKGQFVGKFLT